MPIPPKGKQTSLRNDIDKICELIVSDKIFIGTLKGSDDVSVRVSSYGCIPVYKVFSQKIGGDILVIPLDPRSTTDLTPILREM